MKVGWVGAGADKFTADTEILAKSLIRASLVVGDIVVSGHSPVGGIDIWAEEIGREFGEPLIFAPEVDQWDPPGRIGYKARNVLIAENVHILHVGVVAALPPTYRGRRFPLCYHCVRGGEQRQHVKSGGCWTGMQARQLGKEVIWHVI